MSKFLITFGIILIVFGLVKITVYFINRKKG